MTVEVTAACRRVYNTEAAAAASSMATAPMLPAAAAAALLLTLAPAASSIEECNLFVMNVSGMTAALL